MGGDFLERRLATRGLADKEPPGRQRPLPDVDVLENAIDRIADYLASIRR